MSVPVLEGGQVHEDLHHRGHVASLAQVGQAAQPGAEDQFRRNPRLLEDRAPLEGEVLVQTLRAKGKIGDRNSDDEFLTSDGDWLLVMDCGCNGEMSADGESKMSRMRQTNDSP